MVAANFSITQFPQSQMVIDVDLFRDQKRFGGMSKQVPQVPEDAMDQNQLGTLYTRVSPRPSLYNDKGARDQVFKGA